MKKNIVKIIIFVGVIVIVACLNDHYKCSDYLTDANNLVFLKKVVDDNILLALLFYIAITIVGCVLLALPGATFALFAGVIFGPFIGTFACLIATTIGALLAFLVGRFFLKDTVKPMIEKNKILKKLLFSDDGKNDLVILMITRMIPLFPYNLQNFAYGITDIGILKYTLFTFIFMAPGVAIFTIGAAGINAGDDKWKYFIIAGMLAVLVTAIGILIQKKFLGSKVEN
ncbi:MAG: TVP38/TMEM64 family protein [Clostridioides difficile]|nr:VTT domain-containing protein [Clostridioides sp.]MBS5788204.1 TVP38/TMEM64 family protein [Clostridioides difficile]